MDSIYPNLTKKMIEHNLSYTDIAEILGVNERIIAKKMLGHLPWKLHEVIKLCCYFYTSDVNFLFLQLHTNT
jgi:hypothetical protein